MKVSGFTLIEILVVLVIIGVTTGFALLAFGDFGVQRRIIIAAEQFEHYAKTIREQAILETTTFRIQFSNQSYQVFRFKSPNWQAMPSHGIYRTQYFPSSAILNTEINGKKVTQTTIIFYPSGDITPFNLQIGTIKHPNSVNVLGDFAGNIQTKVSPS